MSIWGSARITTWYFVHVGLDAVLGEPALRQVDDLRGDAFALKVVDGVDVGGFRDGKHPADGPHGGFGVNQILHRMHVGPGLHDPVLPRDPGIEHAVLDVFRHFLRAYEHGAEFRVVGGGKVGAFGDGKGEAGLF